MNTMIERALEREGAQGHEDSEGNIVISKPGRPDFVITRHDRERMTQDELAELGHKLHLHITDEWT